FLWRVAVRNGFFGTGKRRELAAMQTHPREIGRRGLILSLLVGGRTDHRHAQDHVRRRKLRRRREVVAIRANRRQRRIGLEVAREAVAQPERSGKARRRAARSENPDRRKDHARRHDSNGGKRVIGRERLMRERDQFLQLLWKLLAIEGAKRTRGRWIG